MFKWWTGGEIENLIMRAWVCACVCVFAYVQLVCLWAFVHTRVRACMRIPFICYGNSMQHNKSFDLVITLMDWGCKILLLLYVA